MHYTAPTTDDLLRLKNELGLSSAQMAELFGLAGASQWRKYTGGAAPREMGAPMLFFAVARLVLTPEQVALVLGRMRAIGADLILDLPPAPRARRVEPA